MDLQSTFSPLFNSSLSQKLGFNFPLCVWKEREEVAKNVLVQTHKSGGSKRSNKA